MNDTPRTDSNSGYTGYDGSFVKSPMDGVGDVVNVTFARELERELARVVEQRQTLRDENIWLRKRIAEIADDYIPSNERETALALQEMRDALNSLVSA